MKTVMINIYGAEVKCASCVNLPTSLETKEWLEAALSRKFPEAPLQFRYIDIATEVDEKDQKYVEAIENDEYFYPLIVIDDEVVAEGNPKLKVICEKIEELL